MEFDNKKIAIAIAIGFTAILAFVFGRTGSGSDADGYQPITSLAHLDQTDGQAEIQTVDVENLVESITVDEAKPLLGQPPEDVKSLVEADEQLQIQQPQMLNFDEDDAFALEVDNEPSFETSAPTHLDPPATDAATDQVVQESTFSEPASAPTPESNLDAVEDNQIPQSLDTKWKNNPFLSTNAPAFQPVNREQEQYSGVQTASLALPSQSVRSLNNIEGMPTSAPAHAPSKSVIPEVHPSGSMTNIGFDIAPVQLQLSENAAQKAVHHIEYGKSLVRRGATFAARHEFFSALRVIAESNDATINSNEFSLALSKAIRSMKEAEDFNVNDAQSFAVVDVPATIEAHKTKLLTNSEARQITPINAMRRYYAYAGQQIDFASGRNVVSAEALHCLGKLHSVISSQQPASSNKSDVAQAIVFHQSSLLSNPNNPASANELGVLLAKSGNLPEATRLFKKSLISQSTPQAWSNLAKAHHRLGEQNMAQMAQAEIAVAAQSTSIATAGIQWIETPQFNAMAPLEFEPRVAQKTPAVVKPQETKTEEEKPQASIAQRIKSGFKTRFK